MCYSVSGQQKTCERRKSCSVRGRGAPELSPREARVISLTVRAFKDSEIALKLHVSVGTVQTFRRRAMIKLERVANSILKE